MIETIIMLASLVVLGYAFYISARLLWIYKNKTGHWRWFYSLVSIFLMATYSLFAIIMFSFVTASLVEFPILNILNTVTAVFFLTSSGLVGAVMKYHLTVTRTAALKGMGASKRIKQSDNRIKMSTSKLRQSSDKLKQSNREMEKMRSEIERLQAELEKQEKKFREKSKISDLEKEIRIVELNNKLEEM